MLSRREFVGAGLGAVALGLMARRGFAAPLRGGCAFVGAAPLESSAPFAVLNPNLSAICMIEGLPFSKTFTGDWPPDHVPHPPLQPVNNPPEPQESVDVVVVGGGLSGLAAAYLLRDRAPIVLERLPRFGGAAQGEEWVDTKFSLGGAYFITPDKGTFLEAFYTELGLDKIVRVDAGSNPAELNGAILDDFWSGMDVPIEDRPAFEKYAEIVAYFTKNYPEIPLPKGKDNQWIIDLDRRTLRADIEERLGAPAPALLAAGIQSYCYSSFGAGWEEISAAAGWNFIAAEEFGRWVLPGGNASFVDALWRRLGEAQARTGSCLLRAGCAAYDVRLNGGGALVTYSDVNGALRSIQARKVVMACPKYVAKYIIHDLEALDAFKLNAMHSILYRPYVVANVLLNAPIARDFYDLFLLGDGHYPMNDGEAVEFSRVTDVVSGHYARPAETGRSVLTLYWPLPWGAGRFTLVPQSAPLETYAKRVVPQIDGMLALFGLTRKAVAEIRFTRWGHAMPLAAPFLIAEGTVEWLRRPIGETIYFVEQDNWALPAVENSLLEAKTYTDQIRAGLEG